MKFAIIAASLAAYLVAAPALADPCRDPPNGKAFDFWTGDWTVVAVADGGTIRSVGFDAYYVKK
ncbi:MAG TPA: hypothetical protein VII56_14115 [Rhizomicrobium sp.]